MKRSVALLLSLAVIFLHASAVLAQEHPQEHPTAGKANPGFEKLKALAGEWQAKKDDGQLVTASYQLSSGGTSLMETLMPAKEPNMITMYHLNGDKLMMTHYCSLGNQPRMSAEVPTGEVKKLNFSFVDATNMAKPSDGHMHKLTFTFQDKDHFTQEWVMSHDGKEMPVTFNFERKKQPAN
jgi:hypothetical protein